MCSGRVSSSCSTSDTRRVSLVTNSVISHEFGTVSCLYSFLLLVLFDQLEHLIC